MTDLWARSGEDDNKDEASARKKGAEMKDGVARGRLGGLVPAALVVLSLMTLAAAWVSIGVASPAEAEEVLGSHADSVQMRMVAGIAYPVNENGQTYGDEPMTLDGPSFEELPDLVSVVVTDDKTGESFIGYMRKEDCEPFYGQFARINNPEEALAWMENGGIIDARPIYASDGVTQVGWWGGSNGKAEGRAL